jgi:hypothetical protein
MATASVGRAVVTGSSFGPFGTEANALRSNANAQRPVLCIPDAQMASSGQIQEHTLSTVSSRITPRDSNSTHSPAGLAALELELTPNPIIEGILGPNKDGRVRNPVPSKLKGKTDNNKGSFNVMHMGMGMSPGKKNEGQSKDAAAERDAAARRTSENTASRAKAAQSEKYVPPKKRGLDADFDGLSASRGSPFSREDHKQRGRPLAPDETKIEQARLLTLLRSINPVTVVDQICKAVAYFGGIPGAPPPEDGIFPESANTRETGALFIGWLAEIFPDLSTRSPEIPRDAGPAAGKKKGKQTKVHKTNAEADASKEPPNSRNGYGYGPAVSAPAWGLPPSLSLVNTPQMTPVPLPETRVVPNIGPNQSNHVEHHSPDTPVKQQLEELTDGNTSTSKRRRGRPKGSRNKGRGEGGPEGPEFTTQQGAQIPGQPGSESPQAHNAVSKSVQSNASTSTPTPAAFTLIANNQSTASKPHQGLQYSDQSWPTAFPQTQTSNSSAMSQMDDFTPEERAVVEAFRHPQGTEATSIAPSPVTASKPPPETGQKRKRAPPKPKTIATPNPVFQPEKSHGIQNIGNIGNVPAGNESSIAGVKERLQWAAVEPIVPAPPPAKRPRQRKPKASGTNDPPSRTQTASVVSSATPPIPPSTIPDSQSSASQQSIPPTRPPAEGLEAHYERFASLQHQPNGRGTPTVSQQQIRQQPKPPPIPPQQTTPQLQQQQQMQRQKSQQGHQQNIQQNAQQNVQHNVQQASQQGTSQGTQHGVQQNVQQNTQREEPKMTQTSSRPSSTTFYSQRNQVAPTYNQTYPSHQPSQIYGTHQASPQMSNNSSYRSSSTHTLAQASPQFSQAENTYRTASPHTHTQPSPSFSQPDTSFRNTNSHNITQPSPSYSQAENPYRTPSTHSMTQPSSSYTASRSHPQAQPSHQNHYSHFSDSTYIDLPTLESLGHSGSTTSVNLSTGGYGQGIGVALGTSSRSPASSNTLYGSSSGLNAAFDTNANNLLRGVSRPTSHTNSPYGATSSGLGNTFDTTGTTENEMRERLLRGMGRP